MATSISKEDTSFSIIREHCENLIYCACCNTVWLPVEKSTRVNSQEDFWNLSIALVNLNEMKLDSNALADIGLRLSGTLCQKCTAKSPFGRLIQKKQIQEGYFPCFGSARNGYCDQSLCKYRRVCVWDEKRHPSSMEYYSHLFEQIKETLVPTQINAS